jgi:dipeptidyl aminopeptidase/acylaminoacyl peptidase
MPEPLPIWVGNVQVEGIPSESRPDRTPPPHWRLDAIAATEHLHDLTIGNDRRHAVFIQDGATSDLWLVDLDHGTPRRVTTGRDPVPYWEDTAPRLSPDGTQVAYADQGHVWVAPSAGGPPRRLAAAKSPVWLGDTQLIVAVERESTTRLAVIDVADPWPRRLAIGHGELETPGDERSAAVSPDRRRVAYSFRPRSDLKRTEIRVVDVASGDVRALTGTPGLADWGPAWSPDGSTIAFVSERSGWTEIHLVRVADGVERQLTTDSADFSELAWHPDGSRLAAIRGRRNRFDLVTVDAATGEVEVVASGGCWSCPCWTAAGNLLGIYEDHRTPPQLRRVTSPGAVHELHSAAPLAVRNAPYVSPKDVSFRSFDGLEIPGFLFRPRDASPEHPVPAIVYPHGGPTSSYADQWDGHAQYFLEKGYAWLAVNFRGSTGYGREFERLNHGDWGVGDTKDCLAGADFLRTLDWVDGDRLGIFGASYGSYLALSAVTDDPEHRFRCAALKYGDCDIVTSWAQGDREGVQDLERMMGPPAAARAAYRAGSPVNRLANVEVPLLIGHGALDLRVNPRQSEELTAELKRLGGKTYEYVVYPTEAHGLLRAGPQIDFYQRLERFLDWYLM